MARNLLGRLFFGAIHPDDTDPNKPVYDHATPPEDIYTLSVNRIRALPLKNGNYNIYARLHQETPMPLPGGQFLFLGEFPPVIHDALTQKQLGGFTTRHPMGGWDTYVERKCASILQSFIELTGVEPFYNRAPDSLAGKYAPLTRYFLSGHEEMLAGRATKLAHPAPLAA